MNPLTCLLLLATVLHTQAAHQLCAAELPDVLPGTKRLTIKEPLDVVMVRGINRFAERELAASPQRRESKWNRDYSSRAAYEKSIAANRARLRKYIGAVDKRAGGGIAHVDSPRLFDSVEAHRVEWRVMPGVTGVGVLLRPRNKTRAYVVALPDADWSPRRFAALSGFDGQNPVASRMALRLAGRGCQVLIPMLISRSDDSSGHPDVVHTNQPHREWVYRPAFQMGRHVIGYETQKVLAAVDAFERLNRRHKTDLPIGVAGVGEGGLLALHSAALDPRIDAALVCGYFQKREGVWQEPIYRNVWRLLDEFGDAEIASMIAPRPLVIEACSTPEVDGPPRPRRGRRGGAAPGVIRTAKLDDVKHEFSRLKHHYESLKAVDKLVLAASRNGIGEPGSEKAVSAFLKSLGFEGAVHNPVRPPDVPRRTLPDDSAGQKRQVDELIEYTQKLFRRSARVRYGFWKNADRGRSKKFTPRQWDEFARFYRQYVYEEMIGKLPAPTMPLNARSRKIIDEATHVGYEVVLDVYPAPASTGLRPPLADRGVIAAGILLLPRDLQKGEKRPVVVCQHGLEGTPMDTITGPGSPGYGPYKAFSTELVKRGFIVYAPQNPYRGRDEFRVIQRKSNPLGRSLFSYMVRQHERTLQWLASLPNVDPDRIGFYGLSYGGKTAMRVPALLPPRKGRPGYCLSICSADFNEWIRKNVINTARYSYVFTGEYEMFEWNMGHVANYAELAWLISPRPFMVERGHDDGVAPDEWVAWEFAKVRRHYAKLGIADRTEIEFFNGPHTINGRGTFAFLHRHLKWPARRERR